MHHAFSIEAEAEEGIFIAQAWAEKKLSIKVQGNPDFTVLRYGLFTVADARGVAELTSGAAFTGGKKVIIIAAGRAYHEAQNALLKVFEEPPEGTYLFLILPSLGGLLPTLRSRVQILNANYGLRKSNIPEMAEEFIKATKEKRSLVRKKLTSGKDDEEKRELRDEAIALINGIEALAYGARFAKPNIIELLSDIATLRTHLYDRSAPVKMILEHLSLVIPKNLL